MALNRKASLLAVLMLWFTGAASRASILAPGKISLRQELLYNFATSAWIPDLVDYNAKTTTIGAKTSAAFGLLHGLQLDVNVTYLESKLAGGNFLNRVDGDKISGVSEIGFQITKRLVPARLRDFNNYELLLYTGARLPGNLTQSPNDLLALSDGSVKLDFGLINILYLDPIFVSLDVKYVLRSTPAPHDLLVTQMSIPVSLSERFQLGLIGNFLYSLGGVEIGSSEWTALAAASAPGQIPTLAAKEISLGAGPFLAYAFSEAWSLDAYFFMKLMGKSTDKGTTTGIGLSYVF